MFLHKVNKEIDLKDLLSRDGELIIETLVIDGAEGKVLVPQGRYAKMRNVWFIPSTAALKLRMGRVGFKDWQIKDCAITTLDEQRKTDWITFESYRAFLDPVNTSLTIEDYQAPIRIFFKAPVAYAQQVTANSSFFPTVI